MSDIQDYIKDIRKKHETLPNTPSIHVYIKRTNKRLVFKFKNGYKLELQKPKTTKLLGSTKNYKAKLKTNGGNILSL